MDLTCEDLVRFWLEQGTDYSVANGLVRVAAEHDPANFMHLVPDELLSQLKEISKDVPDSIDALGYWNSGVHIPSSFAGLSPVEVELKLEQSRRQSKEQLLRGLTALNQFFYGHSKPRQRLA